MKKILLLTLALVATFSIAACGSDTTTAKESTVLVDITSEQGISMKLPNDMTLQENKSYANTKTGDNAVFAVAEAAGSKLSDWTEEFVLETFKSKYEDAKVVSYENGKQINGKESLVANISLKNSKGVEVTIVFAMITDGVNNYVVNLTYGTNSTEGSLVKNIQTCIDSITINAVATE